MLIDISNESTNRKQVALNTIPLSKNTPSSAPIGQDQAPPNTSLTDLDDSLPRTTITFIRALRLRVTISTSIPLVFPH